MNHIIDKILAFDLEIVRPIPEGETDWKRHRPLGVSCAATVEPGQAPIVWYPGRGDGSIPGTIGGAMSPLYLSIMCGYLMDKQADGYTIFTWNGLSFDFDILAEESRMVEQCRNLAINHVDMMFHFFCLKGFFLGLEAAALGMGLPGKTEGIKGALVPGLWAGSVEDRQRVLNYVGNDVILTLRLAQAVQEKGYLQWVSRSGRWNVCNFADGWLPVMQAVKLPEPDTSWMTNPVSRAVLFDCLQTKLFMENFK
jgi:hypothetical protein